MVKVFSKSCGGLYLIGKVRKDYQIGDILKLKWTIGKLIVVDKIECWGKTEIHVKYID